jgi:outer membrane protein insertion porin family
VKKFSLTLTAPFTIAAGVACVASAWALPAWAFTPFTVKNIEIRGLQHIAPGTVYNYLPIHIGEEVNDQKAQKAIKDLYSTGFFKDVTIARSDNNLLVIVQERPIISSIKMRGIKAFSKSEVNDTLKGIGLVDRHIFNQSILDQVVHGLQQQYEGMGYYNAKIHARVEKLPRNRVAIFIDAKEGAQASIKQVTIVGNHAFSESRLRGLFSIGAPDAFSFFTKNDRYSQEKLMKGLEALNNFYLDRGYLNFDVESSQVQVTPDRRYVYITVNVHEGDVYHVSAVKLSGNLVLPKPEIEKLLQIKPGEVFSRAKINDTNSALPTRWEIWATHLPIRRRCPPLTPKPTKSPSILRWIQVVRCIFVVLKSLAIIVVVIMWCAVSSGRWKVRFMICGRSNVPRSDSSRRVFTTKSIPRRCRYPDIQIK